MASSTQEVLLFDEEGSRADVLRHFAHDLKNPLTAVRVLVEMLLEDVHGQAKEDLQDVIEAVDLCTAMADGLSDFARVEAQAEPTYEIEAVSLTSIVRAVCARAGVQRHVSVEAWPEVRARVDPSAARRAISAVLLNARRMVPAGVSLRLLQGAVVEVVHPGVRMSAADAADLLHPYGGARLRAHRVRASALGLAYARVTMEWLGGTLEVVPEDTQLLVRLRFLSL